MADTATIEATTPPKKSNLYREPVSKQVEMIFREYGNYIYHTISNFVDNQSDVDDIFQNIFLSLLENPIPEDLENLKSYLWRVAKNDMLDYKHKRKSGAARDLAVRSPKAEGVIDDSIEMTILNEECQKVIGLMKRLLPDHLSTTLMNRLYHGHDIVETSQDMGVNQRSSSRYLCVGRKTLKAQLESIGYENPLCTH